jgi:hypothetical protein
MQECAEEDAIRLMKIADLSFISAHFINEGVVEEHIQVAKLANVAVGMAGNECVLIPLC